MYQDYWKLNSRPFSYRLAAAGCDLSGAQQAASLRLQYCIENTAGCALLLGDSGLGKTTLLKRVEAGSEYLRPFVLLAFPSLEPIEQLRMLCGQLSEAPYASTGAADELLLEIAAGLRRYAAAEQHPVICFDDAQVLAPAVMTDVVLPLLNLLDIDDTQRFSVILSGQPGLLSQIRRHPQLGERVAVTARLSGMSRDEVIQYVTGRMQSAGAAREIFSAEALDRLAQVSQGNPRRLNRLCDMALLVGCAEQLEQITAEQIEAVGTELLTAA